MGYKVGDFYFKLDEHLSASSGPNPNMQDPNLEFLFFAW